MKAGSSIRGLVSGLGLGCLLAFLLLPVLPTQSLHAQSAPELSSAARELALAWAGQGDRSVSSHLTNGQVILHLEGNVAAALPNRQAATVLREYLRVYDRAEVELVRAALVEGSRDRGFAEIRWSARRAGTSQPISRTVFLGLRQEADRWTIEEVRVLP